MGRLVDADDLIDKLKELGWIEDTPLDEIINEIPTAYDKEKVIAQIQEEKFGKSDETRIALSNAQEYVRKGGIE